MKKLISDIFNIFKIQTLSAGELKKFKDLITEKEYSASLDFFYKKLKERELIKRAYSASFFINSLLMFTLLVFYSEISKLSKSEYTAFAISVIIFSLVSLYAIFVSSGNSMNWVAGLTLFFIPKYIEKVQSKFRTSLSEIVPYFPDTATLSTDLRWGIFAENEKRQNVLVRLAAMLVSFSGLIYGIAYFKPTIFAGSVIVLLAIFLEHVRGFIAKKYNLNNVKVRAATDSENQVYRDTSPLIAGMGLSEGFGTSYLKALKSEISWFAMSNTQLYYQKYVLFLLIYFLPPILGFTNEAMQLIALLVFSTTNINISNYIENRMKLDNSAFRLQQLNNLLDEALKLESEITESVYQEMGAAVNLTHQSMTNIQGLEINELTYSSGRPGQQNTINVQNTTLPAGKISHLTGRSGIGKSILGRILTMRYSQFEAKSLNLNGKDIRTYPSLDEARLHLLFSGLREVNTSYRFTTSMYLKKDSTTNTFIQTVQNPTHKILRETKTHFDKHADYYGLEVVKEVKKLTLKKFVSVTEPDKVYDIYRNKCKISLTEPEFAYAAVAEYFAFNHLKTLIPEASLYFVDAILSEPPISQGQRRRTIFAFDVLLTADVLVVDEPFSNLDHKSAVLVLKSLADYAKSTNAVVLVLDQKVIHEVVSDPIYADSKGTVLSFVERGDKTDIVQIDPVPYNSPSTLTKSKKASTTAKKPRTVSKVRAKVKSVAKPRTGKSGKVAKA